MSIMGTIQEAQRDANRANLQRYQEGLGLYDQMIKGWKKGGGFAKGAKAGLARARTKSMASGMQSLASSGLACTTMAAGLGKKWEEEVGTPARLSIADIAGQWLMQARQAKAGFIERREDYGPDPGMTSQLMQGVGQASVPTSDPYGPGGYLHDPWKKSPETLAAHQAHLAKMNAPGTGTVYGKAQPITAYAKTPTQTPQQSWAGSYSQEQLADLLKKQPK